MTVDDTACAPDEGSAVLPFCREIFDWQGRIANAAKNGGGLDVYQAALNWAKLAKQGVPPDNGVREKVKREIREAAERHLADHYGLSVIEAIYGAMFPEEADDALANNNKLDEDAIKIDDQDKIKRLAKLSRIEYSRARKEEAKTLRVTVAALDQEVSECRKQANEESAALRHWQVEPWPNAVDPAALLDSIVAVFNRYIVLPKYAAEALALWILHAWTFDAGDISPFVVLTSPTKRCGKTSVLILLNWLTPRSELASNISPSAIFRYIEEQQPCLLVDEADSFLKSSEEARGILNSGHTKAAAYVIRNVEIGGSHKPQRFSTWAPKAIACIGGLAGTLEDRAIIISMQRKPKGAKVARCRRRDCAEFADVRRKALRWAADNLKTLQAAKPALPDALNDRACDNWEPLLAIADLAGGQWATKARDAAKALSGDGAAADDDDGVELLHDIRAIFDATIHDAIFTKVMIEHLVADGERPWAAYGRARQPITDRQVAKLLRPFEIISGTVRLGDATAKGYHRSAFAEAWDQYPKAKAAPEPRLNVSPAPLSDFQPSQRHNADETGASDVFSSVTEPACDAHEKRDLFNVDTDCDAVTLRADEEEVAWTL
jgi:putative DNA primase/helicase